ncbi:MAG TPA: PRC-barrel domain-containing protein, partial [Schlesneria sp.]
MKRFLVSASVIATLMASFAVQPLRAEDEAKGAVPARTDANNPDSAVYRASDIMNMPVKNDDGTEVGHIKDLVINGESREVLYAVVAMNDAKEKDSLYVMPWQVFQPYYGQGNALQYTVLSLPQSVWIQAPFYSASQWRSVGYSQWAPRVNNYYASHINNQRVNGNGRSTNVKAAKPAINDDDVKDSKKADRTDRKNDTDKKNDSDNKDKSDKPAPKSDSDKNSPAPKTAPNPNPVPKTAPNPNPAPRTEAPAAPKAPAVKDPIPNAPKIP